MRKVLIVGLLLVSLSLALELRDVQIEVKGDIIMVNKKEYTISKDVKIEGPSGQELTLESLPSAKTIRLEFDKRGKVIFIKVLEWWI
ncbi:MAG: hypothetical protein AB1353_00275 [Aquificota bacterium]|jgi:hypothetical protein|nr:hypothetical protein [Aquificaceae bacterium]HAV40698.1 hypothetical protein [Aquificaceae bacterium]